MHTVFVIAALCASLADNAPQAKPLVRVYVYTDELGDRDALADRKTSVKDLADALVARKKTFTAAKDDADAQLLIEVIGRAVAVPKIVLGIGPRPGQSGIATGPAKTAELRIRLHTRPGEIVDFKNKNRAADNPRGWKSTAEDLAAQIERWQLAQVVRAPLPERKR
jgi:hypothetical protein